MAWGLSALLMLISFRFEFDSAIYFNLFSFNFNLFIDSYLWYFYAWKIIWLYFCSFLLNRALYFFWKNCFVEKFFKLIISKDVGYIKDVISRIAKAQGVFSQQKKVWKNRNISPQTKIWILKATVKTVVK